MTNLNLIREMVAHVETIYGSRVHPTAVWTESMFAEARALAEACGVPFATAQKLRSHELRALFSVAARNSADAIAMCEKQGWTKKVDVVNAPLPIPAPMGEQQAIDIAPLLAELAEMGEKVKAAHTRINELENQTPRKVDVTIGDKKTVQLDGTHNAFDDVLDLCVAGLNPYLVGPAGSGKTTLAMQIAVAMNLQFYMAAKVDGPEALLGFLCPQMNGAPIVARTPFREAYEHGGVFLLDEMDASDAAALVAFNAALENNACPFPDGLVKRHVNFVAIGAGNTYGTGADAEYVGRQAIDAATIERFSFVQITYDLAVEAAICPNDDWRGYVQALRSEAEKLKVRHIFSPRASRNGFQMLSRGWTWEKCADTFIWKGIKASERLKLETIVPMNRFKA
jgi:hypothetical protein